VTRSRSRLAAGRATVLQRTLGFAAVVGLSLLASACGGSSAAKVAQVATTGSAPGSRPGPLAFAACMRSHGVPNFPDSDTDGRIHAAGIDKSSPAFRAARRSCRALEPGGQLGEQASTQLQRQLLAFAACMRAHGAHTFPDPTITHDGHITLGTQRIDPHSPIFIAAASACRGKLSGSDAGNFFSKLLHRGR
jgi:hypothetical protein